VGPLRQSTGTVHTCRKWGAGGGASPTSPLTEERKQVRCPNCKLVQFVRNLQTCLRCHVSYKIVPEPINKPIAEPPISVGVPVDLKPGDRVRDFSFWTCFVFWLLRNRQGLTAKELAAKLDVPRQYVSKVECGTTAPGLQSRGFHGRFESYCAALEVTPVYVIRMTEFLVFGQ
jgi:hypothetical protein